MIEPAPGDHVHIERGLHGGCSGIVQDTLYTPRPFVTVQFLNSRGELSLVRELVPAAFCRVTLLAKKTSARVGSSAEAGTTPVNVHCHGSGGAP